MKQSPSVGDCSVVSGVAGQTYPAHRSVGLDCEDHCHLAGGPRAVVQLMLVAGFDLVLVLLNNRRYLLLREKPSRAAAIGGHRSTGQVLAPSPTAQAP